MTGTSLDGIDIAVANFDVNNGSYIKVHSFETYPFPDEYSNYIKKIISGDVNLKDISMLNYYLGYKISEIVLTHLKKHNLSPKEIFAIGAHGQTMWHQPNESSLFNKKIRSTLQLLSGPILAIETGIEAITDFRAADIAAGGSGAPLQPIFDHYFLRESNNDCVVLNIGGISNVTYLSANSDKDEIIAFDTGPGNMLIDLAVSEYYNLKYDNNGEIAGKGNLNNDLLKKLMNIDFISKKPPKSTGRELFNAALLEDIGAYNIKSEDLACTLTHFTAKSIAKNIERYCTKSPFKLKVSGGGAKNNTIMNLLSDYIPNSEVELITLDNYDITDSRESLLFAFLAYLRKNNLPGNIKSVTGANAEKVLGSLSLP